jgi:hypothetical protein
MFVWDCNNLIESKLKYIMKINIKLIKYRKMKLKKKSKKDSIGKKLKDRIKKKKRNYLTLLLNQTQQVNLKTFWSDFLPSFVLK